MLILRLPHYRWSLPSHRIGRRQRDVVVEELSVPLSGLPCSRCRPEVDKMEWSVW
jgi:hypothetical protein